MLFRSKFVRLFLLPALLILGVIAVISVYYLNSLQTTAPEETAAYSPNLIKLKRGVNIARWLRSPRSKESDWLENYLTEEDLKIFQANNIDHVRIMLATEMIISERKGDRFRFNSQLLRLLRTKIEMLQRAGINVVIVIHDDANVFKNKAQRYSLSTLQSFWEGFIPVFAELNSRKLAFEPLNEPSDDSWLSVQPPLLASIRKIAPRNTLVATGLKKNSSWVEGLSELKKLRDKNILYTFHFYEPLVFASQFAPASPGFEWINEVRNLYFPTDAENCRQLLASIKNPSARYAVDQYCQQNWNAAKVMERIQIAKNWAVANKVDIWAGEYGVICDYHIPRRSSRLDYLKAVTDAFDALDIPRAIWAYDECWGFEKAPGSDSIDQGVADIFRGPSPQ